jgi:23S rRNA (uracil1939-C5)-methyltransferase
LSNDTTQFQVDRLALEGDGVGRLQSAGPNSGQVVFAPYSLPGEKIEGRLLFSKKNHARYLPVKIQTPSASRQQPPCPYHFTPSAKGPWCGGCNWQHMDIQTQRQSKHELVRETLVRMGGIPNPPMSSLLSVDAPWRYRNKVQVPFGVQNQKIVAGFFSPGTHSIVDFEDCLIQPERSVAIVHAVKKIAAELKWVPYEEDAHSGWLRHLLVRTNEAGQAMVVIITANASINDKHLFVEKLRRLCPEVIGIHQNVQSARTNVILGRHWVRLWGFDRLEEQIADLRLAYSPASFFQVNTKAADMLYRKALSELSPTKESVVLDLYCGVGAMTLMAAKQCALAIGVELAGSSIRDARNNAGLNQIKNAAFVEADASQFFRDRHSRDMEIIRSEKLYVLLDPARTGCEPQVLHALMELKPERLVYVSCHPATLARDIKILSPHYTCVSVTPVDLFPQTAHIETVVRLDRK